MNEHGKPVVTVVRKDFEDWAAEYLLPYREENCEKTDN